VPTDPSSPARTRTASGSEHRSLTKKLGADALAGAGVTGRALAWSPDGRKLAFFGGGNCGQYCFNLWVMNSDGSGRRNLTPKLWAAGVEQGGGPTFDPAWSPDGQMIAFVGSTGRPFVGPTAGLGEPIYVVKADGSGLRNLTPKPVGADAAPAWSPDGRKLAFVSDRDGNSDVYVMNANGKGQRNLTRNRGYDADPAWSPNGRKIAFISNRDGHYGVYVINADGSGQPRLTQRSP
jgi:Tol biopolymer transport system component